jgi:hypothetical protein
VRARIVAPIPGEFAGGTTLNRYYLMDADAGSGGVAADDREIASIRWVTPAEAHDLIALTVNDAGRERDRARYWRRRSRPGLKGKIERG